MIRYLKILRFPNLVIIVLTQYLIRYCLLGTFYGSSGVHFVIGNFDFALLVISTLLIASGGNIINDIFDVEVDKINKPDKVWIGEIMPKKKAYSLYIVLTVTGVLTGIYLSFRIGYLMFGLIFFAIALLLYFYSSNYQKVAFLGNIIVSLLSAMVILITWLYDFFALRAEPALFAKILPDIKIIYLLIGSYAVFAFMTSFIREMVKDAEDYEGDLKAGYKTVPVVYGVKTAKATVIIVTIFTMFALAAGQYLLILHNFVIVFWYLLIAVQSLFVYLLYLMTTAKDKVDFKSVGDAAKIVMVAGILSMQLFCIS